MRRVASGGGAPACSPRAASPRLALLPQPGAPFLLSIVLLTKDGEAEDVAVARRLRQVRVVHHGDEVAVCGDREGRRVRCSGERFVCWTGRAGKGRERESTRAETQRKTKAATGNPVFSKEGGGRGHEEAAGAAIVGCAAYSG